MAKPDKSHSSDRLNRFANTCRRISLVLAISLPFLVPFDPSRNIDLQGLIVIISGAFAWCALLIKRQKNVLRIDKLPTVLIQIFVLFIALSVIVNPHLSYNLLGAPYIRLGSLGLLSCMGIGLLVSDVPLQKLKVYLYALIVAIALVSLPYSLLKVHSLTRIGGVFAQADILACFMGCGLLLGLEIIKTYPHKKHILYPVQLLLAVLLLLTETRAVILIFVVLWIIWMFKNYHFEFRRLILYVITLLLLAVTFQHFISDRLTNSTYATQSVSYRLALQSSALKASESRAIFGYGTGNLADALACTHLNSSQLRPTCEQGYFFNSSHNIFLDRVLEVGWLGGLSFLALVVVALRTALRGNAQKNIFAYALCLIILYYLTNVTSISLELIFWVFLLGCLNKQFKSANVNNE